MKKFFKTLSIGVSLVNGILKDEAFTEAVKEAETPGDLLGKLIQNWLKGK